MTDAGYGGRSSATPLFWNVSARGDCDRQAAGHCRLAACAPSRPNALSLSSRTHVRDPSHGQDHSSETRLEPTAQTLHRSVLNPRDATQIAEIPHIRSG